MKSVALAVIGLISALGLGAGVFSGAEPGIGGAPLEFQDLEAKAEQSLVVESPEAPLAPVGTGFTYQGLLKKAGTPCFGTCDLQFSLWDAESVGSKIGSTQTTTAVTLTNGLFTVELNGAGQFGASAFDGNARWLEIAVRHPAGSGTYTTLSRQPLTLTPYAQYAQKSATSVGLTLPYSGSLSSSSSGVTITNTGTGSALYAETSGSMARTLNAKATGGSGTAVRGEATASSHVSGQRNWGGYFSAAGLAGRGVEARASGGEGVAVFGEATSTSATQLSFGGVFKAHGQWSQGVYSVVDGANGTAINADATGINGWAVAGTATGTGGRGIYGHATTEGGVAGWFQNDPGLTSPALYTEGHVDVLGFATVEGQTHVSARFRASSAGTSDAGVMVGSINGNTPFIGDASGGGTSVGLTFRTSNAERVRITNAGAVGIGTTNPQASLDVDATGTTGGAINGVARTSDFGAAIRGSNSATSGHVYGVFGETHSSEGAGVIGFAPGGGSALWGESASPMATVTGHQSGSGNAGFFEISNTGNANPALVAITNGTGPAIATRGNLQIQSQSTGAVVVELGEGLDYAEGFDVSNDTEIGPGTVLVIDAENPGKLTLSTKAYDTRVAGIAAGAKGLSSAVRLGVGQFDRDVALAGRVYCNVDATQGGVEAGDPLTTSSTPGYAMKAGDHQRAQGAILGKAMEKLPAGERGQILVLVTLQ